ncbi:DUF58 domain-containing protein [Marinilabiliaceae bacterium JC017]|nr:DUF58 domain-containing protein [Marinilabiliaceae bacterium JC017]
MRQKFTLINQLQLMNKVSTTLRSLMKWEHYAMGTGLIPTRRVHSVLAGKHASMLRGRGLDFEEVRQYVPGDDIRNIDWKVTARTKRTHTKVFNEEKERPSLAIVDQSSYLFFGSKQYMKAVIAAELAALAAFRTLKKGDRFGGIVFNDESADWIVPKRSRSVIQQFLRYVSDKNQALTKCKKVQSNLEPLSNALRRVASYVTHNYIISIVSDFTEANEATYEYIKQMARHNDIIIAHIKDDLDEAFLSENLVISDGDKQLLWRSSKKYAVELIRNKREVMQNKFDELMRVYGVPVLIMNTSEPLENQIKSVFKKRKK